jgi:hypothetical protein
LKFSAPVFIVFALQAVSAWSQEVEKEPAEGAQEELSISANVTEATCSTLLEKAANNELLSLDESNTLIDCHFKRPVDKSGYELPPGTLAVQPLPELYQQWDFERVPGVLGEVEG